MRKGLAGVLSHFSRWRGKRVEPPSLIALR
jgi:hypothetical protein